MRTSQYKERTSTSSRSAEGGWTLATVNALRRCWLAPMGSNSRSASSPASRYALAARTGSPAFSQW